MLLAHHSPKAGRRGNEVLFFLFRLVPRDSYCCCCCRAVIRCSHRHIALVESHVPPLSLPRSICVYLICGSARQTRTWYEYAAVGGGTNVHSMLFSTVNLKLFFVLNIYQILIVVSPQNVLGRWPKQGIPCWNLAKARCRVEPSTTEAE